MVMTLEEVLEVFECFVIKILLAVVHIILDVLFWKWIKEDNLGFVIVKFFFIVTIQEFNGTHAFWKRV